MASGHVNLNELDAASALLMQLNSQVSSQETYIDESGLESQNENTIPFEKELFIEEIRKYQCLWNTSNPSYKDRNMKLLAWKAISSMFGKDVEFLKKQLKYLKDNLKKCLDARARLTKSGAAASSLPTCQYFEQMAFLHEKTGNLPTITNIIPSVTSDTMLSTTSAPINLTNFNQQQSPSFFNFGLKSPNSVGNESISFPPSPASSVSNDSRKRKKKSSSEIEDSGTNSIIKQLYNIETELKAPVIEECEDSLFCRSLVPTLKRLSGKKNKMAKIKISQLLFELEFDEECT